MPSDLLKTDFNYAYVQTLKSRILPEGCCITNMFFLRDEKQEVKVQDSSPVTKDVHLIFPGQLSLSDKTETDADTGQNGGETDMLQEQPSQKVLQQILDKEKIDCEKVSIKPKSNISLETASVL